MARILVTTRRTRNKDWGEDYDSLSRDWIAYLEKYANKDTEYVLVPNSIKLASTIVKSQSYEGLILTSGDDIGSDPARDSVEGMLLEDALNRNIAVFGVCRGFQFINVRYGGSIIRVSDDAKYLKHVGSVHKIIFSGEDVPDTMVNSYHNWGVTMETLGADLEVLAMAEDGVIEAVCNRERRLYGVQWHPERTGGETGLDGALMQHITQGKELFL